MRQHAGVFAANFSSNLLWQNCFAPKKCAFCTEPRRAAAGIPDVCQGGATTGLRKTRLLRRMFSYVRRPKGWAFQSVKEPARSRISEAVGRDPCVPPRKGIRIPLASLCEGGGSAKRWRRERFHTVFSPPVGCADSPLPEGASQRGTAALTGRRTPRAFVPLRSTAGRRPLRPMCGCTRLSFRRGRCPHRPAGINAHSAAGHMGPALQGACVRADRVDEPARSQISEGGLV